jgi:hypothetical protein
VEEGTETSLAEQTHELSFCTLICLFLLLPCSKNKLQVEIQDYVDALHKTYV